MSTCEEVILVDANDSPLGTAEKMEAHEKALLHRAFSVFVLRKGDNGLEILMQQRQLDKYHCGGLWTNTCCSHPRPGEGTLAAGERRLQEEMGIQLSLEQVGSFEYKAEFDNGLTEHEFDHVLVGWFDGQCFEVNPREVADYRWVEAAALPHHLASNPELYTPWLAMALALVQKT